METKTEKHQIDFIELKLKNTTDFNMENLIPHPTLRNQYTLNRDYGESLKNFSLYKSKDQSVVIKSSVPYFLYAYNYASVGVEEMQKFSSCVFNLLGLDLSKALVTEFEFGCFEKRDFSSLSTEKYIDSIVGVLDYNIQNRTSYMKMFGNKNQSLHYKIYDAIKNAKFKKTYSLGNYPASHLVKHELKITSPKRVFGREIIFDNLTNQDFIDECKKLFNNHFANLSLNDSINHFVPIKEDLTHILFATIKNCEGKIGCDLIKELINTIDQTNLSASQKSKRKKSITLLNSSYKNQ